MLGQSCWWHQELFSPAGMLTPILLPALSLRRKWWKKCDGPRRRSSRSINLTPTWVSTECAYFAVEGAGVILCIIHRGRDMLELADCMLENRGQVRDLVRSGW